MSIINNENTIKEVLTQGYNNYQLEIKNNAIFEEYMDIAVNKFLSTKVKADQEQAYGDFRIGFTASFDYIKPLLIENYRTISVDDALLEKVEISIDSLCLQEFKKKALVKTVDKFIEQIQVLQATFLNQESELSNLRETANAISFTVGELKNDKGQSLNEAGKSFVEKLKAKRQELSIEISK